MPLLELRHKRYAKTQKSNHHWLWCFLFGPFYFAQKRIWFHAILSAVLTVLTLGLSWMIYPLAARSAVSAFYRKQGWEDIS